MLRQFVNVVREYNDKYGNTAAALMGAMIDRCACSSSWLRTKRRCLAPRGVQQALPCPCRSCDQPGICWRVGVHSPLALGPDNAVVGHVLPKQLKAAYMQLEAVRVNEDDLDEVRKQDSYYAHTAAR